MGVGAVAEGIEGGNRIRVRQGQVQPGAVDDILKPGRLIVDAVRAMEARAPAPGQQGLAAERQIIVLDAIGVGCRSQVVEERILHPHRRGARR
ncbi:hypothetical protein D3C86_1633770 [compost metagenome]